MKITICHPKTVSSVVIPNRPERIVIPFCDTKADDSLKAMNHYNLLLLHTHSLATNINTLLIANRKLSYLLCQKFTLKCGSFSCEYAAFDCCYADNNCQEKCYQLLISHCR